MTAQIISLKTGKDVTPPPTRVQRLCNAVKTRRDHTFARNECAVTLARLTAAFESMATQQWIDGAIQKFGEGALLEIDTLIINLEKGQ